MSRQFRSDDTIPWSYKFGSGIDGDKVVSTDETFSTPTETFAGASGQKNATAGGTSLNNGDLVLIIQCRGANVGTYELNKVVSGGGSTSLVMESDLQTTYATSGNDAAQILKLQQYHNVTVDVGVTWQPNVWNGQRYGIVAFLYNGICRINGTLSLASKGFAGGNGINLFTQNGNSGEGTPGIALSQTQTRNGNAGGGGDHQGGTANAAGGSGGNGTAGNNGNVALGGGGAAVGGEGGSTSGNAELTNATFGGGGGGEAIQSGTTHNGGPGGGMAFVFGPDLGGTGLIDFNGQTTGNNGGNGGGGSGVFKAIVADFTTLVVRAAGGLGSGISTNAGVGRLHLDYAKSVDGTTTPTLDVRQDKSLFSTTGMLEVI